MNAVWFSRIRRKALWVVVVIGATTIALISATALPALPIVGVAFAATVVVLNTLTSRVSADTCLSCAADLSRQPIGPHGRICPNCGAIDEPLVASHPGHDRPRNDRTA